MKLFIGTHSHKHGNSVYLFQCQDFETLVVDDFIRRLGDDFKPDRDSACIVEEKPIWMTPGGALAGAPRSRISPQEP